MEAFHRITKVMKSGFDNDLRLTIVGSRSCNDSDPKMAAEVWKSIKDSYTLSMVKPCAKAFASTFSKAMRRYPVVIELKDSILMLGIK